MLNEQITLSSEIALKTLIHLSELTTEAILKSLIVRNFLTVDVVDLLHEGSLMLLYLNRLDADDRLKVLILIVDWLRKEHEAGRVDHGSTVGIS